MSVTVTEVDTAGVYQKIFDVTATADADTTATITHNLNAAPTNLTNVNTQLVVVLEPLQSQFYISDWTIARTSTSVLTLTKGTGTGSGVSGAQVRCHVQMIHSIEE